MLNKTCHHRASSAWESGASGLGGSEASWDQGENQGVTFPTLDPITPRCGLTPSGNDLMSQQHHPLLLPHPDPKGLALCFCTCPRQSLDLDCSCLACRVSDESSIVSIMSIPLYIICCFSLVIYNICTLCLIFVSMINMCLGVFLLEFILYGSL